MSLKNGVEGLGTAIMLKKNNKSFQKPYGNSFQKPYGNEHAVQHASFLVLNVQSMCPNALTSCNYKRAELESLITDSREEVPVKFVAVTETWLWADHTDAQVNISGFNVSRSDRIN